MLRGPRQEARRKQGPLNRCQRTKVTYRHQRVNGTVTTRNLHPGPTRDAAQERTETTRNRAQRA
eukprot:3374703-Pyramimonas_sp.AAC.1